MKTLTDLKKEITQKTDSRTAQLLLCSILKLTNTSYALDGQREITHKELEEIDLAIKRLLLGEPIQYILGETEFMSLPFKVRSGVLIPRADTECLVERAIKEIKDKPLSVLEIGTGTGCISVSIKHYCKNANITACDISDKALALAKENSELNACEINLIKCDILNEIPSGKFDIIVSNPPYIESDVIETLDKNVRDFEPHLALDGGEDGLIFYRRITDISNKLLNKDGKLIFEIGYNQGKKVSELVKGSFSDIEVIKDLCGNDRVVFGKIK